MQGKINKQKTGLKTNAFRVFLNMLEFPASYMFKRAKSQRSLPRFEKSRPPGVMLHVKNASRFPFSAPLASGGGGFN